MARSPLAAPIDRVLAPFLTERGFARRGRFFRRTVAAEQHLVSVETDKWGGGFWLELGVMPAGPHPASWGEVVPEEKLEPAYATIRACLQARPGPSSLREDWFRFDAPDGPSPRELMERVVALWPQAEAWFAARQVGPNISTL